MMHSAPAISALVSPCATSRTTSTSRGERSAFGPRAGGVRWALHLYPLLWTHLFDVTGSLCPLKLRETWAADLRAYLDDAVRLVGADGSPLLHGVYEVMFDLNDSDWVGVVDVFGNNAELVAALEADKRRPMEILTQRFGLTLPKETILTGTLPGAIIST
ncbi:hypothetical protein AB0F03_35400 [Streptomyces sp. NPDC028722]|uniref:hypothetical protein n=2 Tax=unclassified Streptomyces TaxID=2593676 RepID=UPI00340BA877